MRCHRASDSGYSPSYLPFSEEMPSIVCMHPSKTHATRAFLCVFEIFFAQKIDHVKSLKMRKDRPCQELENASHSESQN